MRHSLPVVLALAAFTAAGFSGPASAISNNLNPWSTTSNTTKKPPATQTKQNPPPTQTNQNTPPATQARATSSTHANQNPLAPQTTVGAPTATARPTTPIQPPPSTQTNSTLATPKKPMTVGELKKDIVKQQEKISGDKESIAFWQKQVADAADQINKGLAANRYHWDPKKPDEMNCNANGKCVAFERIYVEDKNKVQIFEIPVDATGHPLPGAADAIFAAYKAGYDGVIRKKQNEMAAAQQQLDSDYALLLVHGVPSGGVDNHKGSTALHQD